MNKQFIDNLIAILYTITFMGIALSSIVFLSNRICRGTTLFLGIIFILLGGINTGFNKGFAFFKYPLYIKSKVSEKLRYILCMAVILLGIIFIAIGLSLKPC